MYRLATGMSLSGWVRNGPDGVTIEVEGDRGELDGFVARLRLEAPPASSITGIEVLAVPPEGACGFEIRRSTGGEIETILLPDLATCGDCLGEIFDPGDRRYRYPFTNCTSCGPRFSITLSLPYDRPGTTMGRFAMCPDCLREYEDPLDRRFHAQPNACPVCGPQLALWSPGGAVLSSGDRAMEEAARAVRDGLVVAVKGLGGFHLIVDACSDAAVDSLRTRKRRRSKPFALMVADVECILRHCAVSGPEHEALVSPRAPIVLLERLPGGSAISDLVAPGNPRLGIMLPCTPLHHLLLDLVAGPVVATSGNLSDEPICYDEIEALERLEGIADLFLVHDRPIARHVDDSVLSFAGDRPVLLRRGRGYAPFPVDTGRGGAPVLALGAHLKNTVTLAIGTQAFISQHIGDMDSPASMKALHEVVSSFQSLYRTDPAVVVRDMHPDYETSRLADRCGSEVLQVQHHHAHVLSCMADNGLSGPVLGVAWDGTGFGPDGTVWGGEFFSVAEDGHAERIAHLRTFPLPGGDRAVLEPRRSAAGLLSELAPDPFLIPGVPPDLFPERDTRSMGRMLALGINCPRTSSVGRLFDAVAALLGFGGVLEYEGQAAMGLEHAVRGGRDSGALRLDLRDEGSGMPMILDWEPAVRSLLDILVREDAAAIPVMFHNGLVEGIVDVASAAGLPKVLLTGGCFQNLYLVRLACERLREEGFEPFLHRSVPPNDGGISLGQAVAARMSLQGSGRGGG